MESTWIAIQISLVSHVPRAVARRFCDFCQQQKSLLSYICSWDRGDVGTASTWGIGWSDRVSELDLVCDVLRAHARSPGIFVIFVDNKNHEAPAYARGSVAILATWNRGDYRILDSSWTPKACKSMKVRVTSALKRLASAVRFRPWPPPIPYKTQQFHA